MGGHRLWRYAGRRQGRGGAGCVLSRGDDEWRGESAVGDGAGRADSVGAGAVYQGGGDVVPAGEHERHSSGGDDDAGADGGGVGRSSGGRRWGFLQAVDDGGVRREVGGCADGAVQGVFRGACSASATQLGGCDADADRGDAGVWRPALSLGDPADHSGYAERAPGGGDAQPVSQVDTAAAVSGVRRADAKGAAGSGYSGMRGGAGALGCGVGACGRGGGCC